MHTSPADTPSFSRMTTALRRPLPRTVAMRLDLMLAISLRNISPSFAALAARPSSMRTWPGKHAQLLDRARTAIDSTDTRRSNFTCSAAIATLAATGFPP